MMHQQNIWLLKKEQRTRQGMAMGKRQEKVSRTGQIINLLLLTKDTFCEQMCCDVYFSPWWHCACPCGLISWVLLIALKFLKHQLSFCKQQGQIDSRKALPGVDLIQEHNNLPPIRGLCIGLHGLYLIFKLVLLTQCLTMVRVSSLCILPSPLSSSVLWLYDKWRTDGGPACRSLW